jgi:LSD1 subclass zinc finger protein
MVKLKCQECGAALHWEGGSNVIKCSFCGTEYLVHPQSEPFRRERDIYTGAGEVQGIPIVPGNDCSGLCPVESFAPKGWKISASQASDAFYGDHAANPFVAEAQYAAPDGSAFILFRGSNIYTDRKLSRVPLIKQIDVLGSYMRVGAPFNAEQYCDYLVQRDLQPASGKKLRVETADAAELERQKTIYGNYVSQGFSRVVSDWKRAIYEITDRNGRRRTVSVETRVNDLHKGGAPMSAGGFFGMMGQMFSPDEHYWETQYEFIVVSDPEKYDALVPTAQKINESIRYTDDLERIRRSMLQYLEQLKAQTAMAVHQQEMASWDRKQQTISDTHAYTMNVMHEMNANTAATHQRAASLHSESIRGVNTYHTARPGYGNPDVVEAEVRWDRVYQNTADPSLFAASEAYWLEPGVDFEPLKRTDGNY